ncbi:guanylate cyclase, partial [Plakobranchus ocellatus]
GYIDFNFIYKETSCTSVGASAIFAELRCQYGLSALIGPGCSVPLYSIAPLAMAWNIPVVNPVASGLSNKTIYPLVTALSPYTPASFVGSILAFLVRYDYHNVAIVEDTFPEFATPRILQETLVESFRRMSGFKWRIYNINSAAISHVDVRKLVDQSSAHARVFLLFTRVEGTRAIMLESRRRGMATSGDYVYIIIYKLSWGPDDKFTWEFSGANDNENRAYLESLGQAYFPYMEAWPEIQRGNPFIDELIQRSLDDHGYDYGNLLPTMWVPGYYDAIMLYAQVLNETLTAGGNPDDGLTITQSFVNRTFPGILKEVKVNADGIRLSDVTFGYYDLVTADWKRASIWRYETDDFDVVDSPGFVFRYNDGVPPPNEPECGYTGEKCEPSDENRRTLTLIVGLLTGFLLSSALIGVLLYRTWKKNTRHDLWWWKIDPSELLLVNPAQQSVISSTMKCGRRNGSLAGYDACSMAPSDTVCDDSCAIWKGQRVSVNKLKLNQFTPSRSLLNEFALIREVSHANISRVLGACLEPSLTGLVTETCSKGSLQGLCYLHESPVRCHGRLSSQVCGIDNRFTVKLSDYGLPTLYDAIVKDKTTQEYKNACLWKAPEVLRCEIEPTGTRESDIYSCAIVMEEVFTREAPFFAESDLLTLDEILTKVEAGLDPPFRPSTKMSINSEDVKNLIGQCWAEDPKLRPTAKVVRNALKRVASSLGTSTNILDNLMRRMEMYANNLEKMVEDKTIELREEKKKSEELLYQILPKSVANKLRLGQRVEPQTYESVSIFFSDIVGFTTLSAESSPMEIVTLLNDLYTCFDAIIDEYDVYKVETIGDAYMVVSGLPQENGNLHAMHIANMSLKLLEAITKFKIRHRPEMGILLRIGCHSGSVVAGVVGLKMPRYCLFGDTVNTASRMESNGEALKIHLSQTVKDILDTFGTFEITHRGSIPIKGKGYMDTYWLVGRADAATVDDVKPFSIEEVLEDGKINI